MDEQHLYQKIVAAVREEILRGRLAPGERLPTVRQAASEWGCTLGTVQRAYAELARRGLIVSRAGQGTRVASNPTAADDTPLRRALLTHRAEAFLLETLSAGYTPAEVDNALRSALDAWRSAAPATAGSRFSPAGTTSPAGATSPRSSPLPARPASAAATTSSGSPAPAAETGALRFAGSHDLALSWLASHFPEVAPRFTLQLGFNGSLAGLTALQQGLVDLAGCHLWDETTGSYNVEFVRRLLPGREMVLLTLVHRRLGLIVPPGNPAGLVALDDLCRPGLRLANRQPGSGTRVWLDAALRRSGIRSDCILGYSSDHTTHTDVALAVAEGRADVGFGLETAALVLGLDFIPLLSEPYDLVIPAENFDLPPLRKLAGWLTTAAAKAALAELGGYDTTRSGELIRVS